MKKNDYIFIALYLLLHVFIVVSYYYLWGYRNFIKEFYFVIGIISTFLIFDVYNSNLRKRNVLIIWSLIGISQLIFYYTFKDIDGLQAVRGTYIDWLKGVPAALFVNFILNSINKKIFGDYFIVTTFRLDPNEKIKGEDRLLRPTDYLFSIIGFISIICIVVL